MSVEKICQNCCHWNDGECEVKYYNKSTHPGQKCNEVALTARESLDGKVVMFFKPINEEE